MKSLFESINELNPENDFALQFQILGISKGYKIIDKLECEPETKAKLIKYVALAYSYESPLLQKKKDRFEVKKAIMEFLEMETDDFITKCIENKNLNFNKYIIWWLRESQERDFALIIVAEDLFFELLLTAMEGVVKNVTAENEKQAEKVMKTFGRMEVVLKADSYKKAMEVKASMENQSRELQKNYQQLYKTVQNELPEISSSLGWAERSVLKWKQNNQK